MPRQLSQPDKKIEKMEFRHRADEIHPCRHESFIPLIPVIEAGQTKKLNSTHPISTNPMVEDQ
jgi:hypothetical protein